MRDPRSAGKGGRAIAAGLLAATCCAAPGPPLTASGHLRAERHYSVLTYELADGAVTVAVPARLEAGDVVTTSIGVRAADETMFLDGRSDGPFALHQVRAGGEPARIGDGVLAFTVPHAASALTFDLLDPDGRRMASIDVPVATEAHPVSASVENPSADPVTIHQQGAFLFIHGRFDGDSRNTRATLDGQPLHAWLESSRMLWVMVICGHQGGTSTLVLQDADVAHQRTLDVMPVERNLLPALTRDCLEP